MFAFLLTPVALAVVAAPPEGLAPLSAAQQKRVTPIVEVVRNEADGVVAIAATHVVTESVSLFDVFAQPREVQRASIGSGTVIHPSGYVLTNAHVVAMASELSVLLRGATTAMPAHVVAALPDEDIAIVKCDVPAGVHLHAVKLGNSDDVMVGETVIAIGAPVGLVHTVTSGIVSAVDRELRASATVSFKHILQTDAAINPGNSGGPLFNILGEQIGVNTAIRGDAQNVGFAIPADRVKSVLPKLLAVESRGRSRLGLHLGRESDAPAGVVVEEVEHGSPAERSGIGAGMVLTSVADVATPTLVDALVAILEQPSNKAFTVSAVLPEGTTDRFSMTIVEPPPPDGRALAKQRFGLDLADLDAVTAARLGLRAGAGVVVKAVDHGVDAQRAGVQPGDLITRVGPFGIRTVADLAVLENAAPGAAIPVRVVRIGKGRVLQTELVLGAR